LGRNLKEVLEMLLEDGEPQLETQFVGTQAIEVAGA
jgi:predicted subunit of tRNA(5-methylaminomethyl-2-thiouridylate) methyltransferase